MLHIRFNYLLMLTLAFGPISAQRLNAAAELSDTTETAILTIEEATEIITCSSAGTSSAESVALTDSVPPEDISVLTPVIPRYQMRQPEPDFKSRPSIYAFPYSKNRSLPQWHRMWVNTAVLGSAFVSTLLVLECLPEDATTWNRAAIQEVPPFTRWYKNVFKRGPEWDHDNPIFNYVLHPYAGAAYFMSARSCGFNFWQSMFYSFCISSFGWEFGIEAFMERPSYQDLVITPVVGSVIGELFYKTKRKIVENNYHLAGSKFLGNVVVFLIDPVNEVIDLFRGNPCRKMHFPEDGENGFVDNGSHVVSSLMPCMVGGAPGFSLTVSF